MFELREREAANLSGHVQAGAAASPAGPAALPAPPPAAAEYRAPWPPIPPRRSPGIRWQRTEMVSLAVQHGTSGADHFPTRDRQKTHSVLDVVGVCRSIDEFLHLCPFSLFFCLVHQQLLTQALDAARFDLELPQLLHRSSRSGVCNCCVQHNGTFSSMTAAGRCRRWPTTWPFDQEEAKEECLVLVGTDPKHTQRMRLHPFHTHLLPSHPALACSRT